MAACAAAMLGMGATAASAGEISGSGNYTPINPGGLGGGVAASECAFSGLNDGFATEGQRTQSYGQIVRYAGSLGGVPGIACNPSGKRIPG